MWQPSHPVRASLQRTFGGLFPGVSTSLFFRGCCLPGLSWSTSGHLCQSASFPGMLRAETKERTHSSGWWKQQKLKSGSTRQPGSQPMEEDSLHSREGHCPWRKVKSRLNLRPFPIFPEDQFHPRSTLDDM